MLLRPHACRHGIHSSGRAGVPSTEASKEQMAQSPQGIPEFVSHRDDRTGTGGVAAEVPVPASAPVATAPPRTKSTGGFVEEPEEELVVDVQETPVAQGSQPLAESPEHLPSIRPSSHIEESDVAAQGPTAGDTGGVEEGRMHDEDMPDMCMMSSPDADMMYTFASTRLGKTFGCQVEEVAHARKLSQLSPLGALRCPTMRHLDI